MTNTAQLLGLSTSQLSQNLQSGTTLSSLASQQGIFSGALVSSISSDLQADAPQGAQALSGTQLAQMATNIANGAPPVGGGQGPSGVGSASGISSASATDARAENNLSSLASTLGTDPSTLLAQLTSGQSLSSLLSGTSDVGYGTSIAQLDHRRDRSRPIRVSHNDAPLPWTHGPRGRRRPSPTRGRGMSRSSHPEDRNPRWLSLSLPLGSRMNHHCCRASDHLSRRDRENACLAAIGPYGRNRPFAFRLRL